MSLKRSSSRVSDFLDDNQGGHEERGESEPNDDSTDDEYWTRQNLI